MRLAVIGATGAIGSAIVVEALDRAHDVVAASRRGGELHPKATAVTCDATDPEQVAALGADVEAIVSAVGPRAGDNVDVVVAAANALLTGSAHHRTQLVVVGGAGSLMVAPGTALVDSPGFPAEWRPIAHAHRQALEVYRTSTTTDWAYLSPPALIEPGERTGDYRIGGNDLLVDSAGVSRISIADLAVAVVDEVERPAHTRTRFTVAY